MVTSGDAMNRQEERSDIRRLHWTPHTNNQCMWVPWFGGAQFDNTALLRLPHGAPRMNGWHPGALPRTEMLATVEKR